LESALYIVLVPEQLFFLNLSQFSKMIWKAGPRRSVHFLDSELQNLTGHLGVDTTLFPMPTSSSDDVAAFTSDLYLMAAVEVKAAASAGPAAEAQPFYNPVVYHENPEALLPEVSYLILIVMECLSPLPNKWLSPSQLTNPNPPDRVV